MTNFERISKLFSGYLGDSLSPDVYSDQLGAIIKSCIEVNKKLWDLEDLVRMRELGSDYIAQTKQEIDRTNQQRNNIIREIDSVTKEDMQVQPLVSQELFYSETPGMIVDRLSILFIKRSEVRKLLSVIEEDDLREEYKEKETIISKQIQRLGGFFDLYLAKLKRREVFFEIQEPVKIYNDERIRKYIKVLKS